MAAPLPSATDDPRVLHTTVGDLPLDEYRLRLDAREWRVLHTGSVLGFWEEQQFLSEQRDRIPYGVTLWPAAIALAHEVAAHGTALRGARVLELGAGTGLPGIVAAAYGAHVVQTDRQALALEVCRRNGARNSERDAGGTIAYRLADWTLWDDAARYDLILGADVLYSDAMHPHLRAIFDANLARGGRLLLSDPFRKFSLALLEAMESDGWRIALGKWTVGDAADPRPIGVYEATAPG